MVQTAVSENALAIVLSILALLGTIAPAFFNYVKERRAAGDREHVVSAEREKLLVETTKVLIEPLRQRVVELEEKSAEQRQVIEDQEKRLRVLEREIAYWRYGALRLLLQLKVLDIVPGWLPTCDELELDEMLQEVDTT